MKEKLKTFLMMTLGTVLMSIGIYFFKFPNNFSTGGVSGISVLLGKLSPVLSAGSFVLIINVALLLIGFLFVGKDFGLKTVYCSLLMSVLIYILEIICPLAAPLTAQPLLELVFAIFLPAAGSAILFNLGASTGGTDIVAMLIKKFASINISKALFCSDFIIVMLVFIVFGVETWLFSLLGFLAKVFMVNNILESFNMSKYCTVITAPAHADEISHYITHTLHKSATRSDAYTGVFQNEPKSVFLTALTRRQAMLLKAYVKSVDPKAFVVLSNTSEIIGKGFREVV